MSVSKSPNQNDCRWSLSDFVSVVDERCEYVKVNEIVSPIKQAATEQYELLNVKLISNFGEVWVTNVSIFCGSVVRSAKQMFLSSRSSCRESCVAFQVYDSLSRKLRSDYSGDPALRTSCWLATGKNLSVKFLRSAYLLCSFPDSARGLQLRNNSRFIYGFLSLLNIDQRPSRQILTSAHLNTFWFRAGLRVHFWEPLFWRVFIIQ